MAIDLGLDDPVSMWMLSRAMSIIDESVDRLWDKPDYAAGEESEVGRLARALPAGPIRFDHTVFAAADAARGALDQVRDILRNGIPPSMIVLHALLRSALVGSGRIVFALFPADPSARLQNARVLVTQESSSFTRALNRYAEFEQLVGVRPDDQALAEAREQNEALRDSGRPPGDGAVMTGAADVIGAALEAAPEYPDRGRQVQREHAIWVWNTYSGAAHTYAWPQLAPSISQDRRVPGDYPGDFHMVATTAQIAMLSLQSRLESGSANTTALVPMQSEPPTSQ